MTSADPAGIPALPGRNRMIVPSIDGFRGVAAITVVLYHCLVGSGLPQLDQGPLRAVVAGGYLGVDLFFVISGFVLFLPAVLNGGDIGNRRAYFLRRVARIVPAYYLFLAAALALTPVLLNDNIPLPHEGFDGGALFVTHLTFLQHQLGRAFGEPYALFSLSWTLTLEALFYVLLPYIARSFHRHPMRWLAAAVVASVAWKAAITHTGTFGFLGADGWDPVRLLRFQVILLVQFPNYLAHFALGMAGATAFVRLLGRDRPISPKLTILVQMAALAAILLAMRVEGTRTLAHTGRVFDPWVRSTYVALLFAVLVVATALAPRAFQWPVANRFSRWLGDVSYGTYLVQAMVVVFAVVVLGFEPANSWTAFLRMVAFAVPISLAAAWLSFVLVERPARRWAAAKSREWVRQDAVGVEDAVPAGRP